jgi:hypothetical protein
VLALLDVILCSYAAPVSRMSFTRTSSSGSGRGPKSFSYSYGCKTLLSLSFSSGRELVQRTSYSQLRRASRSRNRSYSMSSRGAR